METLIDFGEPKQNGFEYPMALTEKYQPRKIEDFIGLEGPKRLFANLLTAPRPVSILLIGPTGSGKTSITMAFAEQLPGTLHHLSSQKCDVASLDKLNDTLCYYPGKGKFHIVKIDEADQMTDKAQLQLLSRLDGTASLRPKFGGGWERGTPPPVIWVCTCNGRGEDGTEPPRSFEPRFLSRCLVLPCGKPEVSEIAQFLTRIWALEGGEPTANLLPLAEGCDGVRDALTKLEVALCTGMLPKPPKPAVAVKAPAIHTRTATPRAECRGRVCYIAPGQADPDPREWQFRKLSKKGSRVFVRQPAVCL